MQNCSYALVKINATVALVGFYRSTYCDRIFVRFGVLSSEFD